MPGWAIAIIVIVYLIMMLFTYALIEDYYPLPERELWLAMTEMGDFHAGAFFGMFIWPIVLPFVLRDKDARARYKERERQKIEEYDKYLASRKSAN